MAKKILSVMIILVFVVMVGACKKKEERPQPQMPAGHPPMEGVMPQPGEPGMAPPPQNMPKVERKVVVSKDVQAKWKAVKLAVENKTAKVKKEYTVNIGSELAIPDSKLVVKVLAFLPDFKMSDKEYYSASANPVMPAAQVAVLENGKEIWNSWLFSLQPTIHPFQHQTIGLTLVSGVSK